MTLIVRCEDKHRLVSYLYGESSPEEQAAVESHLAACPACAEELAGLQGVRGQLAGWRAPEVDLGFSVTRAAAPGRVPAAARRWWTLPLQAAAAVLVLSAGAALANLEIRYGGDGVSIRTGWSRTAPAAAATNAAPIAAPAASSDAAWKAAIAASEARLRAELASARPAPAPAGLTRTGADGEAVLRQVRALLDESERRQQRELALRVAQVTQDFEAQRRADLVRIEQNIGEIEGLTGAEAARLRSDMNYLMRVSTRR